VIVGRLFPERIGDDFRRTVAGVGCVSNKTDSFA
jgi:hypothetical protein